MKRRILCLGFCLLLVTCLGGQAVLAQQDASNDANAPKDADKQVKQDQPEATQNESDQPEAEKKEEEKKEEAAKKEPPKPEAAAPASHVVKKELLKIEVTLDGTFESDAMTPIIVKPKAWSKLIVLKAVEHGAKVKRGELLIALDMEKIDRAIADAKTGLEEGAVALQLAESQLKLAATTTPMDLAAAKRSRKNALQDLDHYFKVSRAMSLKSADNSLRMSQESLENNLEELRQLEKMYKADDLTEETEEIILKRARASVERSKFYLERAKVNHQQTLKVEIPRRDISTKESTRRAELGSGSSEVTLPLNLKKQRLALAKLKRDHGRAKEKLKEMLADRAAMTVKAPAAGIVYYGKCTRGKFTAGTSSSSLKPGKALAAGSTVMTIVKPRPMFVRTTVPEKELHQVSAGVKGKATPVGYPDMKLTAIVDRVAGIPLASGGFDGRITVALNHKAEALVPGMKCKVKLTTYENQEALTIPIKALMTNEKNDEKKYVFRLNKKGKPKKRPVKIGRRTAEKVEILKGLAEGDKILLERPKDKNENKK